MQAEYPLEQLFHNLTPLLSNPAPFKPDWQDGSFYFEQVPDVPVLVVGAGGLGCEIVKNLALNGIRQIHLVDMDTVDFTNLNRQFLFRKKDVGSHKADAVAAFIRKRCPGVSITTHKKKVQELPFSLYQQFPVIIGGLDNVEARRYLNNIVFQLNEKSEETCCYYIDGATEGFEGQSLLVQPFKTSCYECSLLEGLTTKPKVNYCTIANTPRTPEHCIQYVLQVLWQEERKEEVRDNDNLEHMKWIYEKSLARAKEFKIEGVTEMLTLGVTKNVIPAIASTNALIAAVCTNEVFKLLSGCNPLLQNYLLYKGGTSIGSETYPPAKRQNCPACLMRVNRLEKLCLKVTPDTTFESVIVDVRKHYEYVVNPFINHKGQILLNPGDQDRYPVKLKQPLGQFIADGKLPKEDTIMVSITDKCLKDQLPVELQIIYS